MKLTQILAMIVISLAAAFGVQHFYGQGAAGSVAAPKTETAYERVMRTGTIRCGYIVVPPDFTKDLNTGKLGGAAHEIAEETAKNLGLKIEWTEETTFATVPEGLRSNHYDVVCASLYLANLQSAKWVDFTIPFFYTGTGVFVRIDDHRFDSKLSTANDANVRIATLDGEASQAIRSEDFPSSSDVSLPQSADISLLLQNVAQNKADITFVNQMVAENYLAANPLHIRDITQGNPLRVYGHGFAVNKGEVALLSTLNLSLRDLIGKGVINKILDKYGMSTPIVLRTALPYEIPSR